ncbi:MAG: gamma-glutamylcyclotransferase family protein [Polyangiaceae bacterium]
MTTRVFVYGTLMRGGLYHALIAGGRYVGEATTEAGYRLYDLGPYPALRREGGGVVVGEIYDVDAVTLAELDRLEGHPDYYRRERVRLADGCQVTTYLFVDEHELATAAVVSSGDWRRR